MFLNYIILFSFVKTLNMSLFFQEERDGDFLKACEAIRKENKFMSASDIARLAAKTPALHSTLLLKDTPGSLILSKRAAAAPL